jgi:hypothetical protein
MLPYIVWGGDPKNIKEVHMFVKNNQHMSRHDFKETHTAIRDYLDNLSVKYGILLTGDGTYVFTSKEVKFDSLMVKLATGVNYTGVVENAQQDIAFLNNYLGKKKA